MKEYVIKVVSYKRPNNNTCNLLMKYHLNWQVFVYSFDPFIDEYIKNYGEHVRQITEFDKANLSKKRQLVLDTSIEEGYKYCIMLDDDIESMELVDYPSKTTKEITIEDSIVYMLKLMIKNKNYLALTASYNISSDPSKKDIEEYKCICNNSIFNLKEYKNCDVKYNPLSESEDTEFTLELLIHKYTIGRLKKLCIHNTLQGGTTGDGLSYRFENTNRFLKEANYIISKYPQFKKAIEYGENYFKLNSKKLKGLLK